MQANRRVDTRPELRLRSALHRLGLRFRTDLPLSLPELRVRPDVVFTRHHLAVFLDGCFWHSCPEHGATPKANSAYWTAKLERNRRRDARVAAALETAGWKVVRVWEHEDPLGAARKIADLLRGGRPPSHELGS
jgi:DNA mismatch endonuclease (patch repair protein)